jgi:hypothetical protein
MMFFSYAISFLYGEHLLRIKYDNKNNYDVAKIFSIIYILFWTFEKLNRLDPCLKKIWGAKSAATKMFKLIDEMRLKTKKK